MSAPTLKNIAQKVGVDVSTVSRVLRGDTKCFISKNKQKLIHEYTRAINYRPNMAARNLALKRTSQIAFVLCDFSHLEAHGPFISSIIRGIQESVGKEAYTVSIVTVAHGSRPDIVNICAMQNVYDGLIFGPGVVEPHSAEAIAQSGMPVVMLDNGDDLLPQGVACITTNKQAGVFEAIRYLKQLGHESIAFFGNNHCVRAMYNEAVTANQCVSADELSFYFPPGNIYQLVFEAYRQAAVLTAKLAKFSAVFCANDFAALGLCERLRENNIIPGKDISVVGFDDIEELLSIREEDRFLTTVHKPRKEMGSAAARLLLGIIRKEIAAAPVQSLPCRLVIRKTANAI